MQTGNTLNHFETSQRAERENIQRIFREYFSTRNCQLLTLTDTDTYSAFDAIFISASTTVILEYKRRQILTFKNKHGLRDCLIEFPKWKNLYQFYKAGSLVLYCIEYDDFILIYNLSALYHEQRYNDLDHFFYYQNCTANSDDYQRGQTKKLVRGLEYHRAEIILDKDFNRYTYEQFRIKAIA
jgi:hypothetical protein